MRTKGQKWSVEKLKNHKGMAGKHHSEESKQKTRSTLKGHSVSIETRQKLKKANVGKIGYWKGKERLKGDLSANWKGGITPENHKVRTSVESELWRNSVFARDNWTCQKTGKRGVKLHAHHIQNFAQFPELRFAIDNGITLSDKEHREFHKKYGTKNNTREQLKEFLGWF